MRGVVKSESEKQQMMTRVDRRISWDRFCREYDVELGELIDAARDPDILRGMRNWLKKATDRVQVIQEVLDSNEDTDGKMWLLVNTCNFGKDYPNESFLTHTRMTHSEALIIQSILNHRSGPNSMRYWKVVPSDYKLAPGFEP